MKRYSSYSTSPLDWLGEIPSHWVFSKNRYGFQKCKNSVNESDDTNVLSLTIKGIKIKKDLSFGKSTESYIGHQLVEKGDIVFTPRDFDQTPILSDVSKYDGCISNLYIVDKTKDNVMSHYVNYYWYGLKYLVNYFKNFSHGIRFSFNRFQFDEIPLLIPPLPEQTRIVSFLDNKTKKIDELIEKTEKKIELLKEKRTSLINHCVTKGLNPNVEMKDSGVEWIGEIPSHWGVKKLKYNCEITYGISPPDTTYNDEGIGTLLVNGPVEYSKTDFGYTRSLKWTTEPKKMTTKGSLLFCLRGSTTGRMNITHKELSIGRGVCSINSKESQWFMIYSMMMLRIYIQKLISGSTFPSVTKGDVDNYQISSPPDFEQSQIVEYLDQQTNKIDSTIEKETKRIELLKEYRQSLISEVVTGKIDVRDEVVV